MILLARNHQNRTAALPVGAVAGLPLTRYRREATAAAHDVVGRGAMGEVLVRVADETA